MASKSAIGNAAIVATVGAVLGAGIGWALYERVDFQMISSCMLLGLLLHLHRVQQKNNQIIKTKLDELIATRKQQETVTRSEKC